MDLICQVFQKLKLDDTSPTPPTVRQVLTALVRENQELRTVNDALRRENEFLRELDTVADLSQMPRWMNIHKVN